MNHFTKESIEQAIKNIDYNPSLLNGRESKDYNILLENGKTYPPILVLSEANKILGGEPLVIHDFRNNTRVPFRILGDLGYKIVRKVTTRAAVRQEAFKYDQFLAACKSSNLVITSQLAIQFIAALITKPFVILTGLSGSGKTKLALAFAKWITAKTSVNRKTFLRGEIIHSSRIDYTVIASDKVAVTFVQKESGTKATFPYELINDWIYVIQENGFTPETPTRQLRDAVEKITSYSTQLNSFETHLKAAAFHLISKDKALDSTSLNKQVCIVPVGADWTNREPLLGYPNALETDSYVIPENGALQLIINAINDPENPYFLILDEMNLSHVERYFADFLSGMESSEPIFLHSGETDFNSITSSITLPDNLFIIGTVNIDETTYMFSPKVLDRANVIEFRVDENEMENFLSGNTTLNFEQLESKGIGMAAEFLTKSQTTYPSKDSDSGIKKELLHFFKELKKVGAEFGYRTASEIIRFVQVVKELEPDWTNEQILDAAIMQKLLPKLHGSRRKLEETLKSLAALCLQDQTLASDSISLKKSIDLKDKSKFKYPISLEKLRRMNISLINNNFTSYAEA